MRLPYTPLRVGSAGSGSRCGVALRRDRPARQACRVPGEAGPLHGVIKPRRDPLPGRRRAGAARPGAPAAGQRSGRCPPTTGPVLRPVAARAPGPRASGLASGPAGRPGSAAVPQQPTMGRPHAGGPAEHRPARPDCYRGKGGRCGRSLCDRYANPFPWRPSASHGNALRPGVFSLRTEWGA